MGVKKIKVGIFGGSGYGGSELLRILLFHPWAEIAFVTAGERAGKMVSEVHRNFRGITDLQFVTESEGLGESRSVDAVFLALPHGKAMELVPSLPEGLRVIDLSGDFRLSDPKEFFGFYGFEHSSHELQSRFVYGLSEVNGEKIKRASHISNPGCFATATILALFPLASEGLIDGRVVVDAKTGSSGSGIKPVDNTHHPQRSNSFYAYKPFKHQHIPEIKESLARSGSGAEDLIFMTHSLPVSRGIYASCYLTLKTEMSENDLRQVFEKAYAGRPFIRISDEPPNINWTKMTNYCDLSLHVSGREVAVFSAIDNLVKGAAGQAVQNLNLMCGFDETTGLEFPGTNP